MRPEVDWGELVQPLWRDAEYRYSHESEGVHSKANKLLMQFREMHEPMQLVQEREWRAKFLRDKFSKL